jgi:DNA-3-methyladenine glycosylase I
MFSLDISMDLLRCDWCLNKNENYRAYHDEEWGVPVHDEQKHFEFLVLETAQAGLSWLTILNRREGYRKAFADFCPSRVARFGDVELQRLLQNPEIIRNRLKIEATIKNARAFLTIQEKFGSFDSYIWSFVDGIPVQNRWCSQSEVPVKTPVSDNLSKDMKKRSFAFVGSVTMYAHMQAIGMVNDHLLQCFRYKECATLV